MAVVEIDAKEVVTTTRWYSVDEEAFKRVTGLDIRTASDEDMLEYIEEEGLDYGFRTQVIEDTLSHDITVIRED